jgi:hypothetical protein
VPMDTKNAMRLACACAVMAILLACSCKKETPVEQEPNDGFSRANTLAVDGTIEGTLGTRDDVDMYRCEVDRPTVLDLSLSPVKGVNHSMKVWKGADGPVMIKLIDDMRKSSPERMANLFVEPGTWYISVQHGERDIPRENKVDRYRLTVVSKGDPAGEREPDDSPDTATRIVPGSMLEGYFSPGSNRLNTDRQAQLREEDWYALPTDLAAEKPVIIDIELSGVPGVNSMLYVYTGARELVTCIDSGGVGEGEILRDAGITLSGSYYIMVTSRGFASNSDVAYRLSVNLREYDYTREMEPNNSVENANAVLEKQIEGMIFPDGDRDYYLFRGVDRACYRIEIMPPPGIDMTAEILNAEYQKIFEIDNAGKGGIEVMPDAFISGDFYVAACAKRGNIDRDNSYTLQISRLPYSDDELEIEPNDKKEQATKISGAYIKGYISKVKDRDYYFIEYPSRVRKKISLTGVAGANMKVSITDHLGYVIKSLEVKGDKTVAFHEMIDQKGFVLVEALGENFNDPYILKIEDE